MKKGDRVLRLVQAAEFIDFVREQRKNKPRSQKSGVISLLVSYQETNVEKVNQNGPLLEYHIE